MDKKKIIAILIALIAVIILAVGIFLIFSKKDQPKQPEEPTVKTEPTIKEYPYKKYSLEDIEYEQMKTGTLVLGIADNEEEYNYLLNKNKIILKSWESTEKNNYEKEKYILLAIRVDSCSENILNNKTTLEAEKTTITFDVDLGCGICGSSYNLFEIAVPKTDKISENIELKWNITKNDDKCSNFAEVDDKPILYLYPEKTTQVTVNFANESLLTTTYPKFNNEWKVTVNSNGDIYDNKNNYYYALYWEELELNGVSFDEGFYVSKENAISFLEEKLTILGLNDKERNEFIMYWLPKLESNVHNLVYFELTEELQQENSLIIEPQPDTLIRIRMHVKKVLGPTDIKEQKLTKAKREGFTAIEWGGALYN